MRPRVVAESVLWVGSVDWERELFDELIPLPDGTSYNAYLVSGSERTALIDTVDPTKTDELRSMLDSLGLKKLDYLVAHHAEQDHSGSIPYVLERYPEARLVCTLKAKGLMVDLLGVAEDRIVTVADGETLSLGDLTLEFIHAPWVHWPETMLTYLRERRILFPCDLFGSHLATSDLFVRDPSRVYRGAKRYYAEIMMPFRTNIAKHLERLASYDIGIIAPSHGPLHDSPRFIIDAYRDWVSGPLSNKVVIPYVSMHGSTQVLVDRLISALSDLDIMAVPHRLSTGDTGRLAMELVDAPSVVLGTPTVLAGAHPLVAYAAVLANALRPRLQFASIVGSYGWGGKAVEQLLALVPNLKVEVLDPVIVKGYPREQDLTAIDGLAARIAEKHRGAGLKAA
ncbi:MAG: FprA family A-type flavoprotein [Dehalococcoidia bacterium]|jgi:flavorubredoxin|nr:FprA family A-type flavoprotein [Dehalococcoidia bacterium]